MRERQELRNVHRRPTSPLRSCAFAGSISGQRHRDRPLPPPRRWFRTDVGTTGTPVRQPAEAIRTPVAGFAVAIPQPDEFEGFGGRSVIGSHAFVTLMTAAMARAASAEA